MSCIIFYEKPGCATNRLQKELLRSAGIELEVRNLLREAWTPERLRPFFGALPVTEWFNPSAPAIKYGELDPTGLSAEQALKLMIAQPLLIRRPLIRCGMHYMVDFDLVGINAWLPCHGRLPALAPNISGCSLGTSSALGCRPAASVPR
ncbi:MULTISPECIES: ArsC/Spx/MgsR family protein [Pseudomonadaceae]|jgi:nitrogenase-associated protein|uniref:Arsenate reductase family protein n=2 Tax=Gammaproteobacteria TaxID=1236 RepID=A0AA42H747_STUST|nr:MULTISPECIES: ArsC/Spx/MgsR family protein [Pseudomonadaceae]NMY64677.1 arsenate reductase family protein [Pseudomonas sp. WS 5018]HAV03560.1 arsenate reductase family protein [Pseudomonas sp.]AEA83246.1 arsenate reductase related protein [Stutzerimonas stutzeri DSM 4166]MBE7375097.1 arsenate reductase family protein [Pseudomonas lopnurensis]MDH0146933.1 arsenate reductase family protein [Stutzerimonas stutzeri]